MNIIGKPGLHRGAICSTVSVGALMASIACWTSPAFAQGAQSSEVVVTGSRVVRNGFQQPNAVAVLTAEEIQSSGVKDISEFVQDMPAVTGSWDLQSRSRQASSGTTGLASPALRNLGTNRTLVLLDGRRSVPSAQTGEVDTSNFPQQLISRVDVVTGGASAAYGSDAVSGVINFVLDKTFAGFKGEVSGGVTDYGDAKNWKVQLAAGTPFANDRGHLLVSVENYESDGIFGSRNGQRPKRDWAYNPDARLINPAYTTTNGQPFYIVAPDLGDPRAIKGALIYAGPLRGTAFGEGGQVFNYNFGTVSGTAMSGGDWQLSEMSGNSTFDPIQTRRGLFTRLNYALTDSFNVFTELSVNQSETLSSFCCIVKYDIDVRTGNPYIPASVQSRMTALGLTTIRLGSFLDDNKLTSTAERTVYRGVLGADGDFDAMGSPWEWDFYYQYGLSRVHSEQVENLLTSRFNEAADAVINPATGAIVCRIKLTNPSSLCQPYNPFGWGVVSAGAKDYIQMFPDQGASRVEKYEQQVAAFSVRGEPFSLWAGPVSVATGIEHRREKLTSVVDPFGLQFLWAFVNYQDTEGSYDVTEGFVETLIPLAADAPWARSLDFNAAVRVTDYSTSGMVTTWKAGLVWSPVEDIRVRMTRSRDIRAPNIAELYTKGLFTGTPFLDPFFPQFNGTRGDQVVIGNPDLDPEEADTLGIGVVVQPRFIEGLQASVDYYDIKINDAIANSPGGQDLIDRCFAGETQFCSSIARRPDGTIQFVYQRPINFAETVNRGVDFEVSYRPPIEFLGGELTFRYMGTRYLEAYSDNGLTEPTDIVGQNGALPEWRHMLNASYSNDPFTVSLTLRAISQGKIDNSWIECDTGCPTSTVANRTVQVGTNSIRGFQYVDLGTAYQFNVGGSESQLFFNVRNLLNQDPPRTPQLSTQGTRGNRGTLDGTYDLLGRTFQTGLRFRF